MPSDVAALDAQRFALHPSVAAWQHRVSRVTSAITNHDDGKAEAGDMPPLPEVVRQLQPPSPLAEPQRAAHWAYHLGRLAFFTGQGFAGFAAHHVSDLLSRAGGGSARRTPFERLLADAEPELATRLSDWSIAVEQDYANIQSGAYPMPWDMVTPNHRQYNPTFVLADSARFLVEWTAITRRRVEGRPEKLWLSSGLYPRYYTNTFHYQTDGWFSAWSAKVYEHSTEALFGGLQDIMQRSALLPIADFMREARAHCRTPSSLRLLEVAAGTGRFHTFIKDAYPDLPSVVSDLSPFYLARARSNLRYWRSLRQPSRQLGGVDDTGTEFLQTAAEAIAAPDESFDVVVCVYLFHELPEPIRRAAVSEFFRVLRPGGLAVLTDSVQLGDRAGLDKNIDVFAEFNEPHYRNYLSCDLGALFEDAGFQPGTKYVSMVTKTLSFRKPE
ncbi:hypothetical protein GPECTOR_41g678 [Gonium pectorale]|uniref:Methyltransferase domain-containing protein n=1 Tax=Gonium pectorale TaxID=33097 RepID=A0A150GA47_GONPE|nr:hypothetical protein GPECTOR_41g678 [Gonium pectorale]|eukprot:KXZ46714.1 hypothetical protein GPECTOR_41g678 [Gonium pectorale]